MWGCYKDSIDLPPPLSRDAIDHMTIEQVEMYRYILFPWQPIPVGVYPLPIESSIPEDKEIA